MYKIANQIGSDVPVALQRKNTFLDGKKNKISRINTKFGFNVIIVYPNISCSTKEIYKKNDDIYNKYITAITGILGDPNLFN